MNNYLQLFDFYTNRYEISSDNFTVMSENEIKKIENKLGMHFPQALKEALSYFGEDFYYSLITDNPKNNIGIQNFYKLVNKNFEEYIEGFKDTEKKEISRILKLNKENKIMAINHIFEHNLFYYIDISENNPAVYGTDNHVSSPKPYYKSLVDYIIKKLQSRILNNSIRLQSKIILAELDQKKFNLSDLELAELKEEKVRLDKIIEIDKIKAT